MVPRFDVDVRESYDRSPATLTEINLDLPLNWRKMRGGLVDIIRTCVKELKQCTQGLNVCNEQNNYHEKITNRSLSKTKLWLLLLV